MSQPGYADKIISEAQSLIAKVNGDIAASTESLRALGVDPSKVVSACEPHMGDKQRDELAKLLAQDQEAIQREVDEAAARARFANAPQGGAAKKPRSMI